jgi:uncharacterized protein
VSPSEPLPTSIDLDGLGRAIASMTNRYPQIAAVWVFGSAVRSALRFDSDIDVAVLFAIGASDRDTTLADFAARLETHTSPFPVDAVDLGNQGVMFAHEVLRTGRLVHEADRECRIDFEWKTAVRAFDFAPTHALAMRWQEQGLLRRLGERR